jgi:flagellar biosynthesis protein FlhF
MIGELQTGQGAESSGIQALAGGSRYASPAAQDAYETLVLNGVEKRFSQDLLRRALAVIPPSASEDPDAVLDQLATEMLSDIQVKEFFPKLMRSSGSTNTPRVVALVGPTGVGKTTTLAKIASLASLTHGLKVGLINLDTYRVAAVDQLSTYARIMNVPFRTATNAEELGMALRDFASRDLVLIDTTGRSQKDIRALQEMKEMLSQVPGLSCQLVVSATTRDAELVEIGKRFAIFSPEAAVFSKLDEAITYGPLYNFPKKTGLPLAFFAIGQRVPEDIEEATPERVASLVLDIG